jgi:hypothetical protein
VYSTKVRTRLNTQYNVHIFIGTGWQICRKMISRISPEMLVHSRSLQYGIYCCEWLRTWPQRRPWKGWQSQRQPSPSPPPYQRPEPESFVTSCSNMSTTGKPHGSFYKLPWGLGCAFKNTHEAVKSTQKGSCELCKTPMTPSLYFWRAPWEFLYTYTELTPTHSCQILIISDQELWFRIGIVFRGFRAWIRNGKHRCLFHQFTIKLFHI